MKGRPHQSGGTVLGEGGYGRVLTLDELAEGTYVVLSVVIPPAMQRMVGGAASATTSASASMSSTAASTAEHGFAEAGRAGLLVEETMDRQRLLAVLGRHVVFKEQHRRASGRARARTRTTTSDWADYGEAVGNAMFLVGVAQRIRTEPDVRPFDAAKMMPLYQARQRDGSTRVYVSLRRVRNGHGAATAANARSATTSAHTTATASWMPLYRYMLGDLRMYAHAYPMTLGDVMGVARAVLTALRGLLERAGAHHCDIKPENVLFRFTNTPGLADPRRAVLDSATGHSAVASVLKLGVAREVFRNRVKFVVSDYGSARMHPLDLGRVRGTPGYVCPLLSRDRETYVAAAAKQVRKGWMFWPNAGPADADAVADWIWRSYEGLQARRSVAECYLKNDLHALGVTILNFSYEGLRQQPQQQQQQLHPMEVLGMRLVLGDPGALWRLSALERELRATGAASREQLGMRVGYWDVFNRTNRTKA